MQAFKHLFFFSLITTSLFATTPEQTVNELFTLLQSAENADYIGENVSQLQHALQAAHLATLHTPYDEELVIAALLHDIAHQLKDTQHLDGNEFGVFNHGPIGAAYLRALGFSEKVCVLVQEHATAKRYLVRDPEYYASLSYASQQTLITQGGMMTDEQAQQFENHPYFTLLIAIRHCDDKAKDPTAQVPPLQHYRSILINYLQKKPVRIL